jgi:hypothetical protein
MTKNTPKNSSDFSDFASFFLLEFTKELIRNSQGGAIFELEAIVKEKLKERKKKAEKKEYSTERLKKMFSQIKIQPSEKIIPKKLTLPEPKLPLKYGYLKPSIPLDLGRLNILLGDPSVAVIECNGPGQKIKARTDRGIKITDLILTKEEIDDIIDKFAKAKGLPIREGVFNVSAGELTLSAVVSGVIGSRFLIKRLKA